MTSIAWNPGTPQHVKDQWIDPMTGTNLKGGYGRGGPQRPLPFGTSGDPFAPPQQPTRPPQQNPWQPTQQPQPTQNPWQQPPRQQNPLGMGLGALANIHNIPGQMTGFGEQLGGFGEQMGGFGETLGGYQDLLGGYGEQLGGFGEQLGGFKDEFSGINDKLQNLEQGISSLTDKFGTQQQQSPYQQNFGMNPFGSFNSYNPYFGGLGMFMRRY